MDIASIGENIRKKRCEKGLTQEQLSEKADISCAYIGMIERGEKLPKLETFIKIANSLDVTTDELLGKVLYASCSAKLASLQVEIEKLNRVDKLRIINIIEAFLNTK